MANINQLNRLADVAKILKLTKQTGRSFHVCFIIKSRKVLAVGFNHFQKSNIICKTYKPTRLHMQDYQPRLHAEIDATAKIKHGNISPKKLSLVSIRIDNHGQLAYAAPCPNCAFHLGRLGYQDIYYSENNGTFSHVPKK